MAEPVAGPIGQWISPSDVLAAPRGTGCCNGLKTPIDEGLLNDAITFATAILFDATGRQYPGVSNRIVRPCRGAGGAGCGCGCGDGVTGEGGFGWGMAQGWNSFIWDTALGGWNSAYGFGINGMLCGCGGGCNGCVLPEVVLSSPVVSINQVVIDGFIVDPSEYAVMDFRSLVRKKVNDNGCLVGWPCSNTLSRPSTPYGDDPVDGSRDHTWQVDYNFGRGPGRAGQIACAAYACQLALLWNNAANPECRLPYRTQQINREGLSLQMIDVSLFLTNGMTGLPEVDAFIRGSNPAGLIRRSSVTRMGRPPRNLRSFTG